MLVAMRVMAMRDVETAMLLFAPTERVLRGGGVVKSVETAGLLGEGDGGVMMTAGATVLLGEDDPGGGEDGVAAIGGCRVDGGEESIVAASMVEAMAVVDSVGKGGEPAIERDGKGGIEKSDPELEVKVATASKEEGYDEDVAPDMVSAEIEVVGLDIIIGVGGPRWRSNVTNERPSSCKDARDNSEGSGPRDVIIDCEAVVLIVAGECVSA
jgi:hypothetical protein